MTCTKCGAALQAGAKFCAICGTPLDASALSSRPAESVQPATVPAVTQRKPPGGAKTASMPQKSTGAGAAASAKPPAGPNVDPLGETAADAYAATDIRTTREEIERALAERRGAGGKPSTNPGTNPGTAPPPPGTQEMQGAPGIAANPVSPKAMSHVVPSQQQRTAQIATPPPMQPVVLPPKVPSAPPAAGAGARAPYVPHVPLAPGSSGNAPAVSTPFAAQQAPQSRTPYFAVGGSVLVLWGNGQRYRATVQSLQGTRALVVFPDGQQHWVETQYLTNA
jgi:hypothetical protein